MSVADPLADRLVSLGVEVWYDSFSLQIGDSLRRSIDRGLSQCDFGIVVLSPAFFHKEWPQIELDGLTARETGERRKLILPIWHNVSAADIRRHSPSLADKIGVSSADGIDSICDAILLASQEHSNIKEKLHQLDLAYAQFIAYVYDACSDDGWGVAPAHEEAIAKCKSEIAELSQLLAPYLSKSQTP